MTVAHAKRVTPYREFIRFRMYKLMHPWGDDWDQAAIIAASICNRLQKRGNLTLDDFRPTYKRKQSQSEIQETIHSFFIGRLNGDDRQSGDQSDGENGRTG